MADDVLARTKTSTEPGGFRNDDERTAFSGAVKAFVAPRRRGPFSEVIGTILRNTFVRKATNRYRAETLRMPVYSSAFSTGSTPSLIVLRHVPASQGCCSLGLPGGL